MGGVESVRFVPLNTGGAAPDALTRLLLAGAILRGRIATDGALLDLVVAGQRIPLPKSVSLPPGTAVEVQLTHEGGTPQLRLQVLDQQAARPTLSAPTPMAQPPAAQVLLPPGLAELIKPEQAAVLLPKAAAIPPKALEALLTVFVARPELGRALARLLPVLDARIAEGSLPEELAAPLRAGVETMEAESPEEFRRAIDQARAAIGARTGSDAITLRPRTDQADVRTLVDDLLNLRDRIGAQSSTPDDRGAVKTLDTLVKNFDSANLQNIRAFDAPYQFFTIPFSPKTGIDYVQVHVLGREGRGGGGDTGREAHLVAIDLHLTHLGSLWITVQSLGPVCNCVIRAENEAVRGALDAGATALEDGLRRAGFAAAQVRTEGWDGDRVSAATSLLMQTTSFEAEA